MAKNTAAASDRVDFVPPEVDKTSGAGGRRIVYELKNGAGETVKITRTDYIRQRWADKVDRGQIAAECTKIEQEQFNDPERSVPYQVVYQATKDAPGGPDKPSTPGSKGSETSAE